MKELAFELDFTVRAQFQYSVFKNEREQYKGKEEKVIKGIDVEGKC